MDLEVARFSSTFTKMKYDFSWWRPQQPVYDMFDLMNPDLVLTTGKEPGGGLLKCLTERPHTKVILYQDAFYTCWKDGATVSGLSKTPMMDHLLYKRVEVDPQLASDIAYVGTKCSTMVKLCHPIGKFNIKIANTTPWPVVQYIGPLNLQDTLALYSSCKVVYAESVEDAFIALACYKPFVTMNQNVLKFLGSLKFVEDKFCFDTQEELEDGITAIITDPEMDDYVDDMWNEIYPQRTCSYQLALLLDQLGLQSESTAIREMLDET